MYICRRKEAGRREGRKKDMNAEGGGRKDGGAKWRERERERKKEIKNERKKERKKGRKEERKKGRQEERRKGRNEERKKGRKEDHGAPFGYAFAQQKKITAPLLGTAFAQQWSSGRYSRDRNHAEAQVAPNVFAWPKTCREPSGAESRFLHVFGAQVLPRRSENPMRFWNHVP